MRYFMDILNYGIKHLLFCKEEGSVYRKDMALYWSSNHLLGHILQLVLLGAAVLEHFLPAPAPSKAMLWATYSSDRNRVLPKRVLYALASTVRFGEVCLSPHSQVKFCA